MKLYLDYAASSPPAQACINDFNELAGEYANPSSHYSTAGLNAYKLLEEARGKIAKYINAKPEEVFFTSGSTEGINWAIRGYLEANKDCQSIMCTPVEHPAVYNCMLFSKDFYKKQFDYIPIDKYGAVDLKRFEILLKDVHVINPLVAVIMANNEIGTINDIKAISKLVHEYHGTLLVDATQAICHVPIDVEDMGMDMMVMSAHKIGAFSGSGFLYIRDSVKVNNLMYGGHQEQGRRPGTENFLYDVCLANQIERLSRHETSRWMMERASILRIAIAIAKICNTKDRARTRINGMNVGDHRSPNNLNITIDGIDNQQLISYLDMNGITVSAGSACSSGENKPSRVLKAIGLTDEEARNTIRISVNGGITDEQLAYFKNVFEQAFKALK